MIKTGFKVILVLVFILLSVYFYKQQTNFQFWKNYTPLILNSQEDVNKAATLLSDNGFSDLFYKDVVTLGINSYLDINEYTLREISERIDTNDYRNDPFIRSIENLFKTGDGSNFILYVKIRGRDLLSNYKIYKILNDNAILFNIGNPLLIRSILNYISFILMLLIFSFGSKTRSIISLIVGVLAYFFMDVSSFYNYLSFVLGYFILIMLVETFSFSNAYIKRNNIGLSRIIIIILIFTIPSIIPNFGNFNKLIYSPDPQDGKSYSYETLNALFSEESPNLSNYFSHYSYQRSFIYGYKYMFPTYKNSVTINEFNSDGLNLNLNEKIIFQYDDVFLKDFLEYCSSTELGKFYLDYGVPFNLELKSFVSLYLLKNEYRNVVILAFAMLITSLFFKKNRSKNKY
ncbi:MAG: hypothetical protein JXR64_10550 [Spirochaetales bacterium]|nr:hypothetical protein [Spirochaetales bacterium]